MGGEFVVGGGREGRGWRWAEGWREVLWERWIGWRGISDGGGGYSWFWKST